MRRTMLAWIVTLALPALALAQGERKDLQVFNDVATAVTTYPRFTVFDNVTASVHDGVVVLDGKVTMPFKVDEIERRVARVAGVRAVYNRLKTLPVSFFDDELRYRIARSIYGNPAFWQYASMANPPIHIVVDRGHVVLTGVVNSGVERSLARSLASSFGAFSVENELKTDAEVTAALERME
jgi:hyperosmotically inducible periplasmic protein